MKLSEIKENFDLQLNEIEVQKLELSDQTKALIKEQTDLQKELKSLELIDKGEFIKHKIALLTDVEAQLFSQVDYQNYLKAIKSNQHIDAYIKLKTKEIKDEYGIKV